MQRRRFLGLIGGGLVVVPLSLTGCRGHQHGRILSSKDEDMVGSHAAGAATFSPLVSEAVDKLLGQEMAGIQQASLNQGAVQPKRICFFGIENDSAEELGDFREQLYEIINQRVVESMAFDMIAREFATAGLREAGLRPDQLYLPNNQRLFAGVMEQQGQPFDFMLFAKLTSGTTASGKDKSQRDYLLTLKLINISNGRMTSQQAKIRKGYYKSVL
ncbi:penicillin-binding protein activator LpoB [bacterium]|nr:penicillin-binding protein activator LpoB [bacterium]